MEKSFFTGLLLICRTVLAALLLHLVCSRGDAQSVPADRSGSSPSREELLVVLPSSDRRFDAELTFNGELTGAAFVETERSDGAVIRERVHWNSEHGEDIAGPWFSSINRRAHRRRTYNSEPVPVTYDGRIGPLYVGHVGIPDVFDREPTIFDAIATDILWLRGDALMSGRTKLGTYPRLHEFALTEGREIPAVRAELPWYLSPFLNVALAGDELVRSPDGKRIAFIARAPHATSRGAVSVCVVPGDCYGPYLGISQPVFAPDTGDLVYLAETNRGSILVSGSRVKALASFDHPHAISGIALATNGDGTAVAWTSWAQPEPSVIQVSFRDSMKEWSNAIGPKYSERGDRLTFVQLDGGGSNISNSGRMRLDRGDSPLLLGIQEDYFFTPDGSRLIYRGMDPATQRAVNVIEGEPLMSFEWAGVVSVSNDSRHWAYAAMGDSAGRCRNCIVRDGKLLPSFLHAARDPVFSDDGSALAYVASGRGSSRSAVEPFEERREFVVVESSSGEDYDAILAAPRFLPQSRCVRYPARRNNRVLRVTQCPN